MSIKGPSATILLMRKQEAGAALQAAREVLGEVTPLYRDCGALCALACCQSDEEGLGGMLLHPGEAALYQELPPGFSIQKDSSLLPDGQLLRCEGHCKRSDRPLACRVFPLMFITKGEGLDVALDPRAWPLCPLMPSGIPGLRSDFVLAAQQAASLLAQSPAQRLFVQAQQKRVEALCRPLWEVDKA